MTTQLELLTPADHATLVALDAATNPHPWTAKQWQDTFNVQRVFGLRDGTKVIGAAVVSRVLDEAELLMIAIAPDRQGNGLGRHLLEALLSQLGREGVREMFLEVRAGNARAQALYQAVGANEIGQRRDYYKGADGGREDAHLYAFYLSHDGEQAP
ncbi:ribosomal protein S18-alanine N-acetyltransferase [Andreprevotia chitinilytica]|uniref:ribosomal protein S18-alanine N-acetyltransferase n=1 Tax=Andreprevotia chitinilytica TaxID=396808 RepID=UPI000551303E|nr:ribosomal protein S18-alanine N-acetyltransferase [Andreprevotia chitinilytica]